MVQTWYENNILESKKEFAQNKKNGKAIAWYIDGSIMFIEEYENDKLIDGLYYKKGEKEKISSITTGNGIATIFDKNGLFLKKITYRESVPQD